LLFPSPAVPVLCSLLALAPDAGAPADASSPGAAPAAGVPAGLELPRLLEPATVELPAEAAAAGVTGGTAPVLLTIDAQGVVTAAEVVETRGPAVDDAITAAARRLRFSPARRGGQAIPARIRYQMPLGARPAGPPAPAPAPASAAPAHRAPAPPPAAQPSPAAPPLPAAGEPRATDITVRGASAARRLRESAEAVTVIETEHAQRESADMAEVLSRTKGISIRRAGGLGSEIRFSLNGLVGDQIRFFVDGIPLDIAGFGLGLQNVPVNLIEHVEVYRGVVPVRFGADALGGAINLVTEGSTPGSSASVSGQLGSFGTYRLTLGGRHQHEGTGLYVSGYGFFDHADNDYPVDVEVPDERGRLSPARVHRFHDGFRAYGVGAEVGVADVPWARRLALRVFGNRQDRDIQHNVVMSVPYGEARYWEVVRGATLRYEQPSIAGSRFGTTALVAWTRSATEFNDRAAHVYDWFGRRIRERVRLGEIGEPALERYWIRTALARLGLSFAPTSGQALRLGVTATSAAGSGRDYLVVSGRDPLSADRDYVTVTSGLEYQIDALSRRLESIAFGKSYLYRTSSEEALPGNVFRRLEQNTHHLGVGEQLRWRFSSALLAKASYEWATRLPTPAEVFGDGVLLLPNLRLAPERSHNGNLSLTLETRPTRTGQWRGDVNLFIRQSDSLIVLLGNDMTQRYENVYTARAQGIEVAAGWTSPREYLSLDANLTWESVRNRSDEGTFRDFKGDRIPNRPWLFLNLSARLQLSDVSAPNDELSLVHHLRHVRRFFRGWESLGLREFKQVVPDQTTHTLALTYVARGTVLQSWSLEVQNLTDAKVYDFFGTQRPGRACYGKVTLEY
jgi:vitamin B12 transporter